MRHSKKTAPHTQTVTLTIDNLSHEGRGVAIYGQRAEHLPQQAGKKIFVRFALPGETVSAKITQQHRRFDEADVVQVLSQPSPHRTEAFCRYFGQCGGCALQHLDSEQQLQFKQQVLASHLHHFAQITVEQWLPPIRSSQTDYRRRARFGVRWREKQQQLVIGFRAAKSNYLIDIEHCPILDRRISAQLPALHRLFADLKHKQAITHIEFSAGDSEIALLLRCVEDLSPQDWQKLKQFARQQHWQLYVLGNQPQSVQRVDTENAKMRLHYQLPQFAVNLAFSPLDFIQVNADVNRAMVKLACDLLELKAGDRVLDLFCGLGNFSLALARCVGETGQVIAVEGVADMVERGKENARHHQLPQLQFYQQDLTQDFSHQSWAKQGFDALVIDPPRTGAQQVMAYIARFSAAKIVYISCNPATLARDAGLLIQQGYRLRKAGIMDMFSHTEHVESIALFEKIPANTDVIS